MSFGARALVRLDALKHNFQQIRDAAPGSRIMAVIKANAYGHGLLAVANGLPEADSFAVARLQEALNLRAAGISQPIVLLAGVLSAEDLDISVAKDFELVVHCEQQIEILEASAATGITVWLKLDSGMNRLGSAPGPRVRQASQILRRPPILQIPRPSPIRSAGRPGRN